MAIKNDNFRIVGLVIIDGWSDVDQPLHALKTIDTVTANNALDALRLTAQMWLLQKCWA